MSEISGTTQFYAFTIWMRFVSIFCILSWISCWLTRSTIRRYHDIFSLTPFTMGIYACKYVNEFWWNFFSNWLCVSNISVSLSLSSRLMCVCTFPILWKSFNSPFKNANYLFILLFWCWKKTFLSPASMRMKAKGEKVRSKINGGVKDNQTELDNRNGRKKRTDLIHTNNIYFQLDAWRLIFVSFNERISFISFFFLLFFYSNDK